MKKIMLVSDMLFKEFNSKQILVRPYRSMCRCLKCSSAKDKDILSLKRFVQNLTSFDRSDGCNNGCF